MAKSKILSKPASWLSLEKEAVSVGCSSFCAFRFAVAYPLSLLFRAVRHNILLNSHL